MQTYVITQTPSWSEVAAALEALALRYSLLMKPKTIDCGGGFIRTQVQGGPLVVYVARIPAAPNACSHSYCAAAKHNAKSEQSS